MSTNEEKKEREMEFADYFRISMQKFEGDPKMLARCEVMHRNRILTKFVVKQHNLMAYGFNDGSVITLGVSGVSVFNSNAVLMAMIQKGEKLGRKAIKDMNKKSKIAIGNEPPKKLDS